MNVIICDLKDTGARWISFGDKVNLDFNFLEDFIKEHPEIKTEDIT